MMQTSTENIRRSLQEFELRSLFLEELGWEPYTDRRYVEVEGVQHELNAVAHKRGMAVYTHVAQEGNGLPDSATRRKVERGLAKHMLEHFIVYANTDKTSQIWQWVKREPGSPAVTRELSFEGRPTESFVQRLQGIAFTLDEEDRIGLPDVWGRVQASFDVERVTRRFYDLFKKEHDAFLGFIRGLEETEDREWYASIMLNRLMFVYFIQRKGFLDGNQNYLRDKLEQMRSEAVKGNFLTFYRRFLLRLFHEGLGKDEEHRASGVDALIGRVPYLNGGLFDLHELEENNPELDIPDEAFERIFDFFDGYRWHLDERPLREDNEINPDVLGYIFEKYINQKQMGAYYTQEDVTGYITQNAVIPYLFDAAKEGCAVAFEPGSAMWSLLAESPDRYIYEAVRKGVDLPLPEEIAAGVDDVSKRGGWNRPADEEYALPTETWREHVARRQRCEELRSKLAGGEVHDINDIVTLNLDIRQLAQDAIESAEGPELVRAFYAALKDVSVLDPTCGSGAFLFAALNVLEPMYEACLERMARLVEEDASGERYTDFRRLLSEMERHLSQRYFILKSIMVNNLYGVDIMEEAVEIARLRLFLKLVAQVDEGDAIEPLPDLDFNLKSGNTLVGFATLREVQEALLSTLDFENSEERIMASASEADDAFQIFRWMQTEQQTDSEELRQAKADVRAKTRRLNNELDRYLASVYSSDLGETAAFNSWLVSHRPFHWLTEFYGIMQHGGFNVVVGNPPYVEYSKVRDRYSLSGSRVTEPANLYAAVTDRSFTLTASRRSRVGLVLPISLCGSPRFAWLRETLRNSASQLWLSNYEIFPSKLFAGAFQRLSILLATRGGSSEHGTNPSAQYVTRILRWYASERNVLMATLSYVRRQPELRLDVFPKLHSDLQQSVISKIVGRFETASIGSRVSRGAADHFVFCQEATNYWMKATCRLPYYRKNGVVTKPAHGRVMYFDDARVAACVMAVMNSSLFYVWFSTFSDGFHLGDGLVKSFPVFEHVLSMPRLVTIAERLERDIEDKSVMGTRNTKAGDLIEIEEYRMGASKPILDDIDRVLSSEYGLTQLESDFVINYDIKYRMGRELR